MTTAAQLWHNHRVAATSRGPRDARGVGVASLDCVPGHNTTAARGAARRTFELTRGAAAAMMPVPMSAHEDLVNAARSLRDQGVAAYSLADLIATARRYGSTYPDPVLRRTITTMVVAPDDAAQDRDVFVEVRKGWYRLRR